jgi:hypothetical protein
MKARLSRDAHGVYRAAVDPPFTLVAAYLEQDVQGCSSTAVELIRHIDDVAAGRSATWEGTGNAFQLSLTPGGARIECLWDETEPTCEVGLAELRQVLAQWAAFVDGR